MSGYPANIAGPWAGTATLHWANPVMEAVIGGAPGGGQMMRLGPVLVAGEMGHLQPGTQDQAAAFDAMLVTHATSIEDVVEDAVPSHRVAELLVEQLERLASERAAVAAMGTADAPDRALLAQAIRGAKDGGEGQWDAALECAAKIVTGEDGV